MVNIKKKKKKKEEVGEKCIHDKCYCAHHGCMHAGRKYCDAEALHRQGKIDAGYKHEVSFLKYVV